MLIKKLKIYKRFISVYKQFISDFINNLTGPVPTSSVGADVGVVVVATQESRLCRQNEQTCSFLSANVAETSYGSRAEVHAP